MFAVVWSKPMHSFNQHVNDGQIPTFLAQIILPNRRRQPEDALQAMSMPKMARVNLKSIDYVLTYIVQMNCNDEPNIAYAVQGYSRYSTLTSIFLW